MIAASAQWIDDFIDRWRDATQVAALGEAKQQEFEEFAHSMQMRRFPGAILAWPRRTKPTVYYAIANDAAEWRRLRPLLLAFAGPTLTSFTGRVEPLLPHIPVESLLIAANWSVVARLVAGSKDNIPEITSRALKRMIQMVSSAPQTTREAPRPTSQLLAQFVDALNGNDRRQASAMLDICREELRLDALNLLFLQIQLLAHFGEWPAIRAMPEFDSLCHTRKPRVVAMAMLESLYQCHLGALVPAADLLGELRIWREKIRPEAQTLLRLPIPLTAPSGVVRLYGLAALGAEPRQPALEMALGGFATVLGDIWSALEAAGRTPGEAAAPASATGSVQEALIAANETNTLSAIALALDKFGQLTGDERDKILKSTVLRNILQGLHIQTQGQTPPVGWMEWFQRLADPEFNTSLETLQHAIDEWPAQLFQEVTEIAAIGEAIAGVSDAPPAGPRLADALPFLVAWVGKDSEFPRPGMLPVYEALLFHLVAGSRRVAKTYESATLLIRALFSIGLPAPHYRALLDDCLELAGVGVGTRSIYWLLDILDETIANPAPDRDKREAFWSAVHTRLIPLRNHLTPGQSVALRRLAGALGWDEGCAAQVLPEQADAQEPIRTALMGKHIAIYSLTEAATCQAEQVLKEMAPDVRISVSHELVASKGLKSLAQHADLFVVVTASAKMPPPTSFSNAGPRGNPSCSLLEGDSPASFV